MSKFDCQRIRRISHVLLHPNDLADRPWWKSGCLTFSPRTLQFIPFFCCHSQEVLGTKRSFGWPWSNRQWRKFVFLLSSLDRDSIFKSVSILILKLRQLLLIGNLTKSWKILSNIWGHEQYENQKKEKHDFKRHAQKFQNPLVAKVYSVGSNHNSELSYKKKVKQSSYYEVSLEPTTLIG